MVITSTIKTDVEKFVSVPLSLEQIAFSLSQLSQYDLEILEEFLDKKFQRKIISRGKNILSLYKKGKTIPLAQIQKEFNR